MICINKLEWFILSEKTKKSKGKLWTSVLKKVVTDLSTGGDAELRSPELKLTAFHFRNCMWHEVKNPLHCNYHETSAKEERGNQTQKKWKPKRPIGLSKPGSALSKRWCSKASWKPPEKLLWCVAVPADTTESTQGMFQEITSLGKKTMSNAFFWELIFQIEGSFSSSEQFLPSAVNSTIYIWSSLKILLSQNQGKCSEAIILSETFLLWKMRDPTETGRFYCKWQNIELRDGSLSLGVKEHKAPDSN